MFFFICSHKSFSTLTDKNKRPNSTYKYTEWIIFLETPSEIIGISRKAPTNNQQCEKLHSIYFVVYNDQTMTWLSTIHWFC